jgi:hypothetical protein
MELIVGQMVEFMMEVGMVIDSMVKESILIEMIKWRRENG